MENTIIKSINDERDYRIVTLKNDLQCLLIHDKDADKSAATLSVRVGFYQDPEDRPGLAHFLEHMLFLGTEKYPNHDDYSNYITENSGSRNAYTDCRETNYFFDCSNQAFYGALDRFSQFFIAPLFTESCTEREINAVNSEHEKNILQDIWRQMQLLRSTSKEGHVYNRFGTGNKDTLQKPTIRDDLLAFHSKYYSANIMKAVLYGKESLETLEQWAREFFEPIKNNKVEIPPEKESPFAPEVLGTFWNVLPIRDKDYLDLTFFMEDYDPHYKNNPLRYLSHVLGHEGPNSLLSYLIDAGYATALMSSIHSERDLFSSVSVNVELTKKGLDNYKEVGRIVFAFIKIIQEKGPQESIFDELKKTLKFQFDFSDKQKAMGYTSSLATRMHLYPSEDLLRVSFLMEEYDVELFQKALGNLRIENMKMSLISKSTESQCDKSEKWYGQKYSCQKLDQEFLTLLDKPTVAPGQSGKILDYPPLNEFIPENFDIFATDFESLPKYPEKIYESSFMSSFFKQDNTFKKPKATVLVKAYCNDLGVGHGPRTFMIWGFWLKLFNEALREMIYQAEMAKLHVSINYDEATLNGIKFEIIGFNDSIDKICIDLFKHFKNFDPSPMQKDFENQKQKSLEEKKNFKTNPPYIQAFSILGILLHSGNGNLVFPEESYELLSNITFQDILDFHRSFYKTMRFDSLFIGNLTKEKALETTKHIEAILSTTRPDTKVLPKELTPEQRVFKLESNSTFFYERVLPASETGTNESNSSLVIYYQFERQTIKTRLLLLVLANYIKSPFFNVLRTEEQLGYIVHSAHYPHREILGLIVLIQSDVKPSHYLSQRISAFLEKSKEKIDQISDEEFNKHVESIRATLKEKDLSIVQEGARYWIEINCNKYLWNRKQLQLEKLNEITKEDLKDVFNRIFFTERKQLELHIVSQQHIQENEKIREERLKDEKNFKRFSSPEELLRQLELYPDYFSPIFENLVHE